jgi:PAS domain S-box-containing protein
MNIRKAIVLVLLCTISVAAFSQGQLFVRNFLPTDYPGKNQNWAVKVDTNNVVWIANQDGVMSFNGNQWQIIHTNPQGTIRSISFNHKGELFAGGISDIGKLEKDSSGQHKYVTLKDRLPQEIEFSDVWSTHCLIDTTVFITDNYLIAYTPDTVHIIPTDYNYYYLSFLIDNQIIVQQIGGGLFKYINGTLKPITGSEGFSRLRLHNLFYFAGKQYAATKYNGLYEIKFEDNYEKIQYLKPFKLPPDLNLKEGVLYQAKPICKNLLGLATTQAGLYVVDSLGNLVYHFNTENQLITDAVYDFACTKNGAIWLGQDLGLSLIEMGLPIAHYNYKTGIKGSVTQIYPFKKRVFVTTGFGLYWYDKNAPFHKRAFHRVQNVNAQAWGMVALGPESNNQIYVFTADGISRIENNVAVPVYDETGIYTLFPYSKNPDYLFAGTRNGLILIKKGKKKWEKVYDFTGISQQVREIGEDEDGNIWIAVSYRGYIPISPMQMDDLIDQNIAPVLTVKDTSNGLTSLRYIMFENIDEKLLFYTFPDLFTYNSTEDRFELMEIIYPDSIMKDTALQAVKTTRIDGRRILLADDSESSLDSIALNRLPFTVTNFAWIDTTEVWMGTENGLYHYRFDQEIMKFDTFNIVVNQITIGKDNPIFVNDQSKPTILNLDYSHNSISVSVGVPFYYDIPNTKVSFYLEGFDDDFEPWHKQFKKTYTNLPAGKYKLFVKAQNTFGYESSREILNVKIEPPLYLTPFAYLIYIVLWILLMFWVIRTRTKALSKSRDKLEAIVQERTHQLLERNEEVMQVAEILKNNNKRLEELSIVAEKAGNAVAIFNKTGKLDYCNVAFEKLYGYTCKEFREVKGGDLLESSEYPHIKKAYEESVRTKQTVQYEYFTLSRDHEGLWIHTTLTPVFGEDGDLEQFIAIDTNITQLKNAEEEVRFQKEELERKSKELAEKNQELRRLSIIARETDNAVILTDRKGSLLWLNEGYTRLYGYTLKELKSTEHNVFTMSSNNSIKNYLANWPENQSSITYESKNTTKSGTQIWAQTTLTPIRNEKGDITQIIAIDSDITALKKAEEQIEKQRDQLKTLNATKDKFFSIIGHDLRSPFGNFVNMTNIIIQSIATVDRETLLDYVSKLHRSAQNSYNLLENLLDWARHQQGRIKYYPDFDDVTAVVEEMAELLLPLAERKRVKLKVIYDEPVYAYFDEHMIKTVVRNLMFNALKFTPSGGEIALSFLKENDKVKIFVKDTGIGISKEAQKKIFRMDTHFSTLGTDKERGTGLGLMLSKDFVEMNNGTIEVESVQGEGSTFIVTLPGNH